MWISRARWEAHVKFTMRQLRIVRDQRRKYRDWEKGYTERMNKVLRDAITLGTRNADLTSVNLAMSMDIADLTEKNAALDSELHAANEELARRRMQDPDQWPSGPIIYSENFAEHGTLGAAVDKSLTRLAEMKPDPSPTEGES